MQLAHTWHCCACGDTIQPGRWDVLGHPGTGSTRRTAENRRVSDLDVVDYLQIFGSTTRCSELLGISQSSCSRRYRLFSAEYNLAIGRGKGDYDAGANLDILDSLRRTAQTLRLRSGAFRLVAAWPCGDLAADLLAAFPRARVIPIAPMASFTLLNLLDRRLVDLVIGGLMELESLLPQPISRLPSRLHRLTAATQCLPLCSWELRLMAHQRHPLNGRNGLSPQDLAGFPSPALDLGDAPSLMQQLGRHNLASRPYRLPEHQLRHWEGAAADGHSLSYAAPHQLARLRQDFNLLPLPYRLGITETIAVIGPNEALVDSAIGLAVGRALLRHPQAGHGDLHWLISDGHAAAPQGPNG